MGEAPNGRMTLDQTTGTAPSTADVKAAIRETRQRLADHLTRTAAHVHLIFTNPDSVETEPPVSGAVAGAIKTIAVAGRARRVWADAKRMGVLRRQRSAGVLVVIGAALVAWTRRR
jgi:hypothetical protein